MNECGHEMRDHAYLTTPEAAEHLGLSPRTLERWRVTGEGPRYRKLGRAVRYSIEDLEAFARAGQRTSTSASGDVSRKAPSTEPWDRDRAHRLQAASRFDR